MRISNLETRLIDPFVLTPIKRGTEPLNPPSAQKVLFLKCWGSDYPYLQTCEKQERWLPVLVVSGPSI
jgi:hypothetical protein